MMTTEYGKFEIRGHTFVVTMPSGDNEPNQWTITVWKDGKAVRTETVPMSYEPRYGPDAGDVAGLDERTEAIIKEMGLE